MNMWDNLKRSTAVVLSVSFLAACSDVDFAPDNVNRLTSGMSALDTFTQGFENRKLDILFVVDNSGSMADEQEKMGQRIDSFMSTLHDVNWQIGVTTTDVSNGNFGLKGDLLTMAGTSSRVLTPKTPDYELVFKNTVVRPESICTSNCPSGDEQPFRAAIMAMEKRNSTNRGFFRDGAELAIVVLTDEDERSNGPPTATQPEEVLEYANSVWGANKDITGYGMIVVPGDSSCLSQQGGNGHYGTFVQRLANLTKGLVGSICANDYGPSLSQIGENARKLLGYIQLRATPVLESVHIDFSPAHTSTWWLKGRRIYFDNPPPKGTLIKVQYTVK